MSRKTLDKTPARGLSHVFNFAILVEEDVDAMRLFEGPTQLTQGNITNCFPMGVLENSIFELCEA